MEIIPNAVDASRLLPAAVGSLRVATRRELGIAEDAFVFLLIGTYEPRKGHRALFRALSRAAGGEKTVAICAGNSVDPHYREECRQRADAPDLRGRVRLLDFCEAPARLYAAADALVQPSVVEGFSLTSLEAAAFGLPLVLTDVGGARELLERHPIGLLVPGYLEDLAEAAPSDVDRVLNQPPEAVVDGLAAAMSQMRVQAATWRAAAQRHAAPVAQEHEPREIAKRYERRFDLALGR
jgi:glycosyltransferase involved in cell wall biosynthesis